MTYQQIIQELKKILRQRKISYEVLASMMKVPDSTVKKWFVAKDGSFSRLAKVCEALHLSIGDVLRGIEKQQTLTLKFSDQQQKLFKKNSRAFAVYWLLVYERVSVDQVREKFKGSQSEFENILYQLANQNLVKILEKDRVQIPKLMPIRWSFTGDFMSGLLKDWALKILVDGLQSAPEQPMILQFFQMTAESVQELQKDLRGLEEKYTKRTIQELAVGAPNIQKIRFLTAMAVGSYIESINRS